MSLRSDRTKKSRLELSQRLGDHCARCGARDRLEFDVIRSVGSYHHFYDWPRRIRFYWGQLLNFNLQLLCRRCHRAKTALDNSKGKGWYVDSFSRNKLTGEAFSCEILQVE